MIICRPGLEGATVKGSLAMAGGGVVLVIPLKGKEAEARAEVQALAGEAVPAATSIILATSMEDLSASEVEAFAHAILAPPPESMQALAAMPPPKREFARRLLRRKMLPSEFEHVSVVMARHMALGHDRRSALRVALVDALFAFRAEEELDGCAAVSLWLAFEHHLEDEAAQLRH